ncbi:MAG: aromatic ring-hydroxylating dioxygenase subunit alpha [Sphaerobacter sp.]|nr:aromatic ring-hydroxylating dioxygenase subunit alpha [Sphaerobacter sp.]
MVTETSAATPFATTLPGRYYYDPALYQREQERIFGRMWVCVGRADAIPRPGDYLTVDLAGESVIVVRGHDGAINAFLNVCRHRGARLCTERCGHVTGAIQCRYHAWSYGLDGRLLGAPNIRDMDGFDRAAYGLIPVACALWGGLVWLNLADDPAPLAAQIDAAILQRFGELETVERYRLDELAVGHTIVYDLACNWKLVVENFMECYHCAITHPELSHFVPSFKAGLAYQQGVGARFSDGVDSLTVSGKTNRPPLPGLLPQDLRTYYGFVLLPNVFVNLIPDHVVIHTLWPEGPTRTRIVCDWLFDPAAMAQPDFDPMDAVAFFDLVNRQDWEVCELCQQNMASRAYQDGGLYVPLEAHIRAFNDFVLARLEE